MGFEPEEWPHHERTVTAVRRPAASYPTLPPFHPSAPYPEYAFDALSPAPNRVYDALREALSLAGLDRARFGTPDWNPLGAFIRPGQFVLLKPNWVSDRNPPLPGGWEAMVTHGSVVRAAADYVWRALEGRGRVMVADGPQTDASFGAIVERTGVREVERFYRERGLELEVVDLRREEWRAVEDVIVGRRPLPGDPSGSVAFDLGERSEFVGHGGAGRYYGADYDRGVVNRHHEGGRHEYLLAASALRCDVFINLPKLKTHKKAGITVSLKNLVGVNADKNYLPHYTVGSPPTGGDQYPMRALRHLVEHRAARTLRSVALATPGTGTWLLRRARRAGRVAFGDNDRVVRSGNWHGNDTVWRMCLDLNKLVLYGQPDGTLRAPHPAARKPYLSFVDGIVAGEGNGPLEPSPVAAGLILFGTNPAAVDAAAATLMGFAPDAIPTIRGAFAARGFPLAIGNWRTVACVSDDPTLTGTLEELAEREAGWRFRPHFGWAGRIERRPDRATDHPVPTGTRS